MTVQDPNTAPLTGPITAGLDRDLCTLWDQRLPDHDDLQIDWEAITWKEIIDSICLTAKEASEIGAISPELVVERQIQAVREGNVHGEIPGQDPVSSDPFCGCLVGHAGHAVQHYVAEFGFLEDDSLFGPVRDDAYYAPIEILSFLLRFNEQNTPQAALVIRALEQAKAVLVAQAP